jgi:hypothetical protein
MPKKELRISESTRMTSTEKLARYESAQEILSKLIASQVVLIHREEQKPDPDLAKVQQLKANMTMYMEEDAKLFFGDSDNIESIVSKYGPVAKAAYRVG